jgi:hypothetical protein
MGNVSMRKTQCATGTREKNREGTERPKTLRRFLQIQNDFLMRKTVQNSVTSLRPLTAISLVASAIAVCALFSSVVLAGDNKSSKEAKNEKPTDKPAKTASAEHQKLTGQELYAINCNRCHSERYPTEWTAAHWKTIMTHMRVRANLPADQAKEILKYLQQDAGN